MDKQKVIVICGSSRFVDVMAVCAWVLERDEHAIVMTLHLLPQWYPDCPDDHLAEHEGVADEMDKLHLNKLTLLSELGIGRDVLYEAEVFVVDVGGYVGKSTTNEVKWAETLGLPIRYYSEDPIGEKVEALWKEHQKRSQR